MYNCNQTEERLTSNIAAGSIAESSESFMKFARRNTPGIFNALFYDKEPITEEDVDKRVKWVAEFFNLPVPALLNSSDCLAQISFSDISDLGSEIRYDLQRLQELGINNLDAFDAILSHEITHQFLADAQFNFCVNQSWAAELACDYIVGYRFGLRDLSSGKYRYVVSQFKESESHPAGIFRINAVVAGYELGCNVRQNNRNHGADYALLGFNLFLCNNSKSLNESYNLFLNTPAPPLTQDNNTELANLPDSNLIKKFLSGNK